MGDSLPSDSLPKKQKQKRAKAPMLNLAVYKSALEASGLTQEQVMVRVGCARSTYKKWTLGYEGIRMLSHAMRLAAVLGLPMRTLLREAEHG